MLRRVMRVEGVVGDADGVYVGNRYRDVERLRLGVGEARSLAGNSALTGCL